MGVGGFGVLCSWLGGGEFKDEVDECMVMKRVRRGSRLKSGGEGQKRVGMRCGLLLSSVTPGNFTLVLAGFTLVLQATPTFLEGRPP
jgi:hypothetical protein